MTRSAKPKAISAGVESDLLVRDGCGSLSCKCARELSQDRQVDVKLDSLKPTDPKRQRPLVLESADLPLDGGATTVKLPPARRLTRDQPVSVRYPSRQRSRCHTAGARSTSPTSTWELSNGFCSSRLAKARSGGEPGLVVPTLVSPVVAALLTGL
jgi:hypothetical protein